jgi:hypothetical protein
MEIIGQFPGGFRGGGEGERGRGEGEGGDVLGISWL